MNPIFMFSQDEIAKIQEDVHQAKEKEHELNKKVLYLSSQIASLKEELEYTKIEAIRQYKITTDLEINAYNLKYQKHRLA